MSTTVRARDRGIRRAKDMGPLIGRELSDARRAAGVSQRHVARVAGLNQPRISRTERGDAPAPRLDELAMHATSLGIRLVVKLYPEGSPVRDAGHLRLLGKLRAKVGLGYRWRTEVPIGPAGDLRAWDAELAGPVTIGVDAETRLHDIQDLERRINLKQGDSDVDLVVLLVAGSHHNRLVLRQHRSALASTFPFDTAVMLRALTVGAVPPGNGIVLL